jgi:hypothetical protein
MSVQATDALRVRGVLVEKLQKVLSVLGVEAHRESLASAHERHLTHGASPLTSPCFEAPVLLHRRVWHLPFGSGHSVATPGSQQDDPAIPGRDEFTPRSERIPSDPTHQQFVLVAHHEAAPAKLARGQRATPTWLPTLGPIVQLAASPSAVGRNLLPRPPSVKVRQPQELRKRRQTATVAWIPLQNPATARSGFRTVADSGGGLARPDLSGVPAATPDGYHGTASIWFASHAL